MIVTIILTLGLSLSLQAVLAEWIDPSGPPPANNIPAPLNVGTDDQAKLGGLGLGGALVVSGRSNFSGFMGLGTISPNSQLHLYNTAGNPEIDLQGVAGTGNHWAIYNSRSGNDLRFWRGNDQLTILNNGNVGIGTNSPSQKLEISGNLNITGEYYRNGAVWNGAGLPAGYISGLNYKYIDGNKIQFSGGAMELNGEKYILAAPATLNIKNMAGAWLANTWYYVYAKGAGGVISQFSASNIAPVWSDASAAWLSTDHAQRALAVVRTNASSAIHPFYLENGEYAFLDMISVVNKPSGCPASATTISLGLPDFGRRTLVDIRGRGQNHTAENANAVLYLFTPDKTFDPLSDAPIALDASNGGVGYTADGQFLTSISGQLNYYGEPAGSDCYIWLKSFHLPESLVR